MRKRAQPVCPVCAGVLPLDDDCCCRACGNYSVSMPFPRLLLRHHRASVPPTAPPHPWPAPLHHHRTDSQLTTLSSPNNNILLLPPQPTVPRSHASLDSSCREVFSIAHFTSSRRSLSHPTRKLRHQYPHLVRITTSRHPQSRHHGARPGSQEEGEPGVCSPPPLHTLEWSAFVFRSDCILTSCVQRCVRCRDQGCTTDPDFTYSPPLCNLY